MKNSKENIDRQIQFLVKTLDQNVLELIISDEISRYYIYSNFEPSFKGTATSVEFSSGKVMEITSFLEIVRHDERETTLKQAFQAYVEKHEFMNFRFSNLFRWITISC